MLFVVVEQLEVQLVFQLQVSAALSRQLAFAALSKLPVSAVQEELLAFELTVWVE